MSKQNNANWDHYKVAGREHPVDDVQHEQERQRFSGSNAHAERADAAGPHIPNQERASQPRADRDENDREGAADRSADPQNISGTEAVEPTLSDDEGHTG
jgi:hypothetical protein